MPEETALFSYFLTLIFIIFKKKMGVQDFISGKIDFM